MAFKSIGTLASDVLRKAARTAARREARELKAAHPEGGASNEPPAGLPQLTLSGTEGKPRAEVNGKAGEAETSPAVEREITVILPTGRDRCAALPQTGRVPRPAAHLSLVAVHAHASSPTGVVLSSLRN